MSDEEPLPPDESVAEPAPPSRGERLRRAARARPRLTLALAAVLAALLLVGGGSWAWSRHPRQEVVIEIGGPLVFRPLPEFLADLKPDGGRLHHVRLVVVAQIPDTALKAIEQKEPEIVARVQAHVRQLERGELVGQAGSDRLRQDVLAIVNAEIAPVRAQNVLFTQFLLD